MKEKEQQPLLKEYMLAYGRTAAENNRLLEDNARLQREAEALRSAPLRRFTSPLRAIGRGIGKAAGKNRVLRAAGKGTALLFTKGPGYLYRKGKHRLDRTVLAKQKAARELARQRREPLPETAAVTVCILVDEAVKSLSAACVSAVLKQTHPCRNVYLVGKDAPDSAVSAFCAGLPQDSAVRPCLYGPDSSAAVCLQRLLADAETPYIAILDSASTLTETAIYDAVAAMDGGDADFIFADERELAADGAPSALIRKPGYAPDTLRSLNYVGGFFAFTRQLWQRTAWDAACADAALCCDLALCLTEKAVQPKRLPKVLSLREAAAPLYRWAGDEACVQRQLDRLALAGEIVEEASVVPRRIRYAIQGEPLVSVIIPNKDHTDMLDTCLRSIREKTTWKRLEVIVAENNSAEEATFAYYDRMLEEIRVVHRCGPFNYSAINNEAVKASHGDYVLLLNNDTEVISPDWIQELLMYAQRPDVGAVGARLLYPDGTIQHAGLILSVGGAAGHALKGCPANEPGPMYRACSVQNVSGVTGACLMVKRSLWDELGGLDERFAVAYNDVDFCLRLRARGLLNVYTPWAELIHYESKSRGYEDTPHRQKRFEQEQKLFLETWQTALEAGDPYYNPNLSLWREDFSEDNG